MTAKAVLELDCNGRVLHLRRTVVMGILNITPDSFSDGGFFLSRRDAVAHALKLVEEGADIIMVKPALFYLEAVFFNCERF